MTIENYKKAIEVADLISEAASRQYELDSLLSEIVDIATEREFELSFVISEIQSKKNDTEEGVLNTLDIPEAIKGVLKADSGGIKSKLQLTVEMQALQIAALEKASQK